MTELHSPFAPAADVRHALRADIQRLLARDESPPLTIGEIAKGDDLYNSTAQRLIDSVGSIGQVDNLHDLSHIDQEFDWSEIADTDRARVNELLTGDLDDLTRLAAPYPTVVVTST